MKFAYFLYAVTNICYLTPDGSNSTKNEDINVNISTNGNNLKFSQYLNEI